MTHYITSNYKRLNSKEMAPKKKKSMWGKTGGRGKIILQLFNSKPARGFKPFQITNNFAADDTVNLHCYVKLDNTNKPHA